MKKNRTKKLVSFACATIMLCTSFAIPASASGYHCGQKTLSGSSHFDKSWGDDSWYETLDYVYCRSYGRVEKVGRMVGFYEDYKIGGDEVRTALYDFSRDCKHSVGIASGGKNSWTAEKTGGIQHVSDWISLKNSRAVFSAMIKH